METEVGVEETETADKEDEEAKGADEDGGRDAQEEATDGVDEEQTQELNRSGVWKQMFSVIFALKHKPCHSSARPWCTTSKM